jgi:hypothetical protein
MKEDKLDKLIAATLREKMGAGEVPYEKGAWESFELKRSRIKKKSVRLWLAGLAASLALIFVVAQTFYLNLDDSHTIEIGGITDAVSLDRNLMNDSEGAISAKEFQDSSALNQNIDPVTPPKQAAESASVQKFNSSQLAVKSKDEKVNSKSRETIEKQNKLENETLISESASRDISKPEKKELAKKSGHVTQHLKSSKAEQLIAASKDNLNSSDPSTESNTYVKEVDFPEIATSNTKVSLGMEFSPGFGGVQTDNVTTNASTIGLGMLVDIKLPGKLVIGSGIAVNYLSQINETQSVNDAFGRSFPQNDKIQVKQVQVELPVILKYPITKSNSISLQAGFSNYYAVNQTAEQESQFVAQSPVYGKSSDGSNSFAVQNSAMAVTSPLDSNAGKFYPFATLNIGVNLRVAESKNASYVVMPFYNYQVKQISGYGDTYGLFGASFKVNFGGREK